MIGLIDAAAKRWATDPKYLLLKDQGLTCSSQLGAVNGI